MSSHQNQKLVQFFENSNFEIVPMYFELDGNFPNHHPDPSDEHTLEDIKKELASGEFDFGFAYDGDADRIGLYDETGKFVDSHHILLLLLLYLGKYKGQKGHVIITFSVTDKMKKLAALLNLPIEVTAIGFKYIADIMTQKDVLVGGEESGGRGGGEVGASLHEFVIARRP